MNASGDVLRDASVKNNDASIMNDVFRFTIYGGSVPCINDIVGLLLPILLLNCKAYEIFWTN